MDTQTIEELNIPEDHPEHELLARLEQLRQGGDPKYHERLKAENKMFARARLDILLDPGSFVEDGLLARVSDDLPADAVITGIGKIDGRPVAIIANDMTVKAGEPTRR
jgi:methylmalonyl-CoA decarboxylase subunit alpha